MINAYWEDLTFTIQEGQPGEWRRVADTALSSPDEIAAPGEVGTVGSLQYLVRARSIVVLRRPHRAEAGVLK